MLDKIKSNDNFSEKKGIIIDTNERYKCEGGPNICYMMNNCRIATFGKQKKVIDSLNKGDIVLFYHKGRGIVAAGTVISERKEDNNMNDTWYRDVDFLIPPPKIIEDNLVIQRAKIEELTGKLFCWRGTLKSPKLSIDEAKLLVDELQKCLDSS